MDHPPFRVGLLGGSMGDASALDKRGSCNLPSGDLYQYPNASSTVDATQPVTFRWNTDCQMNDRVDLYLYEPSSANGLIQVWQNAPFSDGKYTAVLRPKWWNDTTTANLQLSIMNAGSEAWDSVSPPGPVFKVTFPADKMFTTTTDGNGQAQTSTVAAAATNSHDAVFQDVSDNGQGKGGISKGGIAAAVILPLLFLAAVAAVVVKFWRKRENEKLKRWSQALSSASNLEWEKGALPGERPGGNVLARPNSQFSVGRPNSQFSRPMSQFSRAASQAPSSVYAVENNMAGTGAVGNFPVPRQFGGQQRSQSVENLSRASVRQSRISFADTERGDRQSRLSMGDQLTRPNIGGRLPSGSRSADALNLMGAGKKASYATGSAVADDDDEMNVSPSQVQGPGAFADAEMKRAANGKKTGKKSIGSTGSRRNSTTSAVSTDDFRSAASARGSVDELRDMEANVLARRSQMSVSPKGSPAPEQVAYDGNQVESLTPYPSPSHGPNSASSSSSSGGSGPTTAGSSTVAYGPDQMLAVYAARAKANGNGPPAPGGMPMPMPMAPAPGDMRSYVHLNNGTASSNAVHGGQYPVQNNGNGNLGVPQQRQHQLRGGDSSAPRMSSASELSTYSEEEVGEAR